MDEGREVQTAHSASQRTYWAGLGLCSGSLMEGEEQHRRLDV